MILFKLSALFLFIIGSKCNNNNKDEQSDFVLRNNLADSVQVDNEVSEISEKFNYINIALVKNAKIIYAKSYGSSLNIPGYYASVSKPVTATIILQLYEKGYIESLDDNIWKYSPRYKGCMPDEYKNSPLTIKQLLTHSGGLTNVEGTTWKDGKLNLLFKPGTGYSYSTGGYLILGDVLEDITGKSYKELLIKYIGEPVGAESFATWSFPAAGAGVKSTIEDMSLFTIGVMNNVYISSDVFYKVMLQQPCLGWQCSNTGSDDVTLSHPGSNGTPVAYMIIKPKKKISVVIQAKIAAGSTGSLGDIANLSYKIIDFLEKN